jgi:hypothetical protein
LNLFDVPARARNSRTAHSTHRLSKSQARISSTVMRGIYSHLESLLRSAVAHEMTNG